MSRNRFARHSAPMVALLLAALLLTACTHTITGYATYTSGGIKMDVPPSDFEIVNDNGSDIDQLAANSMDDITAYWDEHFEGIFDTELEPLQGGVHAYDVDGDMPIPCFPEQDRQYAKNNAFYCPSADAIGYDRAFLEELADTFGDFIVPLVMAHEYGHAIQGRVGRPTNMTISAEGQADCYAGVFTQATVEGTTYFKSNSQDLTTVLGGYLLLRDQPGATPDEPQAHGSAFDRVNAFQEGFYEGGSHCYTSFGSDREYTGLPYTSESDYANAGNMPYEQMLTYIPQEMNTFGSVAAGDDWTVVQAQGFSSDAPSCDSRSTIEHVFYCPDGETLYVNMNLIQQAYDNFGDFAAMTMMALGYSEAIQELSGLSTDSADGFQSRLCLVGSYAGAAFEATAAGEPSPLGGLKLSAGDLDEAVMILIALGEEDKYISTYELDAFERIDTFRQGVLEGRDDAVGAVSSCLDD